MRKTVLISGASSGIGYEFAHLFAQHQYDLVLVARSETKLQTLKADLEAKYGVMAVSIPKDLAQPGAAEELFHQVNQQRLQIDVLINNAGFGNYGLFVETDWNKEAQMIQLNITSLTHLTKLLLQGMVERQQGKILNVASTAAFQPGPLMAVYFATKAYVLSFTEAIANELQGTGVTAIALCPGPTESQFQATAALENSKLVAGKTLPTAAEVAQFGFNALQRNQTVAVHGLYNRLLTFVVKFLPRNMVTASVRQMQESGV